MNKDTSSDWLDKLIEQLQATYPEGELIVASGHSPSGVYHIGTLREVMTANAITWALRRAGRQARHIDFVDDYDALRKIPTGVPASWEAHIGKPLALVPDPAGCHVSYGSHYVNQLYAGLETLGSVPDESISGYTNYRQGVFNDSVATVLDNIDKVRTILTEVGGRQLKPDWAPVQILDSDENLRTLQYAGWDAKTRRVSWRSADGATGTVELAEGRIKLDWRLDWPARWAKWGVRAEPFGRDHATKGGSYDTGKVLAQQIFQVSAPFPIPYEFINSVGETKKMSKSSGQVLTPQDALSVMPTEILRYFIVKARPSRSLAFDAGLGLYTLIDEYSKASSAKPTTAMAYARAATHEETIAPVPFNHLVAVFQAAREDIAVALQILERTGYQQATGTAGAVLAREFEFVKNWLNLYAPDSVKFSVSVELPTVELSDGQRTFLSKLAETVESEADMNGQAMHDAIYASAQVARIKPAQAFIALYRVIIGKDSGPKAGWFLASLERDWLVTRLRKAGATKREAEVRHQDYAVKLPDGRHFRVAPEVLEVFPAAAVGYVAASVKVEPSGPVDWAGLRESLASQGISRENIAIQPAVAGWRQAYKAFGVKPSDYRCSVEMLIRRLMDDKPAQVNSVVDLYNYVSVKHLLPMGAMDLDHVEGDITLRYGRSGEVADLMGVSKPIAVTDTQVVYADDRKILTWLWNYRDSRDTAVRDTTTQAIFFIDSLQGRGPVEAAQTELAELIARRSGSKVLQMSIIDRNGG